MSYKRKQFDHQKFSRKTNEMPWYLSFNGGYYYDIEKQRYIHLSSVYLKNMIKTIDNKRFRRGFKQKLVQNQDDEILIKDKSKVYNITRWY